MGFFQAKSHLPSIFTRSFRYLGKRSCSILAPAKAAGLPQKERKHSLCRAKETLQESRVLWQLQGKAHLVRASDTFASIVGSEKKYQSIQDSSCWNLHEKNAWASGEHNSLRSSRPLASPNTAFAASWNKRLARWQRAQNHWKSLKSIKHCYPELLPLNVFFHFGDHGPFAICCVKSLFSACSACLSTLSSTLEKKKCSSQTYHLCIYLGISPRSRNCPIKRLSTRPICQYLPVASEPGGK